MTDLDHFTAHDIAQCLLSPGTVTYDVPPHHLQHLKHRDAAVLLPLMRRDQAWHMVFIRRTASEHDYHSGQVAFPGGKAEPSDPDLIATALREAQEEIGLDPQQVQVLGQLPAHYSISSFRITPIVGAIPSHYPFQPAADEVARVFSIPLTWLAQPTHCELRLRTLPSGHTVPIPYFQTYDHELLWGATARMVLSLLELLQPPS